MAERARTAKGAGNPGADRAAAAALVHEHGVAKTSVDDVIEGAGASKSQLDLYFADRAAAFVRISAFSDQIAPLRESCW